MTHDELMYYLFYTNHDVDGKELLEKMSKGYYYTLTNINGYHEVTFEFCKEKWTGKHNNFDLAVLEATAKALNFTLPEAILCQLN